jgi:predicted transcriptional regulator
MDINTLVPAPRNLAVNLDQDLADKLRLLAFITGKSKTAIVNEAIRALKDSDPA